MLRELMPFISCHVLQVIFELKQDGLRLKALKESQRVVWNSGIEMHCVRIEANRLKRGAPFPTSDIELHRALFFVSCGDHGLCWPFWPLKALH